MGVVWGRR